MRFTQPITLASKIRGLSPLSAESEGLWLKNRFVMAPVKTAYGTPEGRVTSLEFFEGLRPVVGKRVLVIGAGMVGMEAAELLIDKGHEVTATKRSDTVANDMEMVTKKLMLMRLSKNPAMTILTETTVLVFEEKGVRIRQKGSERLLPSFDTVIIAAGMNPVSHLATALEFAGMPVVVIGDASHPADIYAATQDGYRAARGLTDEA